MKNNRIFIPGNVPSSKNSKQWTGKMLIHSKPTRNYIRDTKQLYTSAKKEFMSQVVEKLGLEPSYPLHIDMYFIRNSRRKFDYINPAQTVQDLMVKWGWIEDDNCDIIIPHFSGHHVDKDNPGVLIKVLNMNEDLPIMWGYEEPEHARSKEHIKFLIEQYNRNRPSEEHVHNMTELNRALLTNEIKALSNGKGDTRNKTT
tara:strand:- start:5782 stop:6381 length:600 start_codon:yes stop_codon:yes gene_type:complete